MRRQHRQYRSGEIDDIDPGIVEPPDEFVLGRDHVVGRDDEGSAAEEGSEDFPDGDVEGVGVAL
ncbi:hypothetical protein MSS4_02266 [Mycobacterium marinum]|nr:hypothetical protein DSM43519_02875 [Mycobacterium marinum]RFZ30706.1 hypothetical protein NCTC2275_03961 [Mycobacterium marinum]RFZ50029.1 hypothetical protein MSS4_02266 [Mycobacterium marinum]RFZ61114.1 hypothetical protein DE4576_05509 [Mycobacterium marinum]